jgi:hypothetical protein
MVGIRYGRSLRGTWASRPPSCAFIVLNQVQRCKCGSPRAENGGLDEE